MSASNNQDTVSTSIAWSSVRLTALDPEDDAVIVGWNNDPAIRDFAMGFRFPIQRAAVRDWIEGAKATNGKSRIVFAIRVADAMVGTVQIADLDYLHRKAAMGLSIGASGQRGRGIGFIACSLTLDYLFRGINLRRVGLTVAAFNIPAIRLYEKLGFVREGVERQAYFLDGTYHDVYCYGLLAADWPGRLPADAYRLIASCT